MTSNINEKYIEYLSHSLQGVNGGIFQRSSLPNGLKKYSFPCPFCSHTRTTGNNKRKRDACLLPIKGSFKFIFSCRKKGSSECSENILFPQFLQRYNNTLYQKYLKELGEVSTSFKFKPPF